MRSGEVRKIHVDCRATIGEVGNEGKQPAQAWQGRRNPLARCAPDGSRVP
jgi:ribosomal protein L2